MLIYVFIMLLFTLHRYRWMLK